MAYELGDNGVMAPPAEHQKTRNGPSRGSTSGPGRGKPEGSRPAGRTGRRTQLRHMAGFDVAPGRGLQPKEAPAVPHGEQETIKNERDFSPELVQQFKDSLQDDLERLVDVRKGQTPQQFESFLRDSGHGYYVELFNRLTTEKAGTNHRFTEIDKDKMDEFLSTDAGLAKAYDVMHLKLIEMSTAYAATLSVSPDIPKQKGLRNNSRTRREGGPLREIGRSISHWAGEPMGLIHGRGEGWAGGNRLQRGLQTKGRLTATLTVGGIATGGILPAIAGMRYLSRRGETLDINVSSDALRAYIGDPKSPTPEAQSPNTAKAEYSRQVFQMDPRDFRIGANGEVVRKEGTGATQIDDKSIEDELAGLADLLLKFQKQNGIRPEQRQIGIDWVFDGTSNRPTQGTPSQKWIDGFNPDRDGIRDINGNTRERDRIPMVPAPRTMRIETPVRDASGNIRMEGGNPRMIQATNPDGSPAVNVDGTALMIEERDASGNAKMENQRQVTERRFVPIMIQAVDANGNPRLDARGNPIMVPQMTEIPDPGGNLLLDQNGNRRSIPVTNTIQDSTGNDIDVPIMVPLLDQYNQPITDTNGNPIRVPRMRQLTDTDIRYQQLQYANGTSRWEANPDFLPTRLDVAGNIRRAEEAISATLEQGISETFQDIIDGKSNYINDILAQIKAKKDEQANPDKGALEAKKRVLEADLTELTAELAQIKEYQKNYNKRQQEIRAAQERQERIIGQVTDATGNVFPTTVDAQNALNDILQAGSPTVAMINGQPISSIPDAYAAIDRKIETKVNTSKASQRLTETDVRVTTATGNLATAETDLTTAERDRQGADRTLLAARQQFIKAGDVSEMQRVQENLLNNRQTQDQLDQTIQLLTGERNATQDQTEQQRLDTQIAQANRQLSVISGTVTTLEGQQQTLQNLQNTIVTAENEHQQRLQSEANARAAAENARRILAAEEQRQGAAQDQLAEYEKEVRNSQEIADERSRIQQQNELVTNVLKQFTEEGANITTLGNAAIEGEDDYNAATRSHDFAFQTVTALHGTNGVTLDDNALRTESFEELTNRIDRAGGSGAVDHTMLLHAMIQARAESFAQPPLNLDPLPAELRALQDVTKDLDERTKAAEKNINKAESGDKSTPELDALDRAARRYDDVVETFMDKLSTDDAIDTFLGKYQTTGPNPTPPPPTIPMAAYHSASDNQVKQLYNATEQQLSVAGRNILDTIFGHTTDNKVKYKELSGSEAAIKRNLDLLGDNPQEVERTLINLIRTQFNITGITATTSLGETIDRARTQLGRSFQARFSRFLSEDYLMKNILPMAGRF